MTYRPTVRYSDIYKDYVEDVYKATHLDRNQIIRLALFIAAHSPEYNAILKKYKIGDVSLPHPGWEKDEERAWKDQNYIKKQKAPDHLRNAIKDKTMVQAPSPLIKIIDKGGIQIKIG
jgi:hypothetical protein